VPSHIVTQLRQMFPPDAAPVRDEPAQVIDMAEARRLRETAAKLGACLVCKDPTGVRCCEYGREPSA
jgi:hypothetical protein